MRWLVLLLLVGTATANPVDVKKVPWALKKTSTTLDWVMAVDRYDIELVHKAGEWAKLEIRVLQGRKLVHQWTGTSETPLVIKNDTLYYVEHHPISSGAALTSVDLKTGKQRFKTALKGIGPQDHSKYRNQVWLEVKDDVVIVQGEESHGKYVELVDPKTGKTLANDQRK